MLRYCPRCRKDFDFEPKAVSGAGDIYCPECGNVINKNSRHPIDHAATDRMEQGIGNVFAWLLKIAYIYYLIVALIGVLGFIFKIDMMLYIATGIAVGSFLIQFFMGTLVFKSGFLWLPAGAAAGYFIFKSIQGACLGVDVVFLVRHLLRDVLFRIINKLVKLSR